MSRSLSATARGAMFAQQTSEVFIVLLTITHPTFDQDIRVCSDPFELLPDAGVKGIVSRGNEFLYVPFDIILPQQDSTNSAKATLSVDNVGRALMESVRTADSAIRVKIEVILASSPDAVEISIDDFRLATVSYDSFTVSGDLSVEYYDLEPFPSKRFTPADFPGIF